MARAQLRSRPPWLPELLWVAATALVTTLVAIVDLRLWKMDPDVPLFSVDGDGAYYLASVKGVVENGWFWRNADLGAPFGQSNYDFAAPFGDVAHYAIVAVLGVVLGGDAVLAFNAFFLVCFPLIAVIAYGVLRDLGAAPLAALVAAVLFAFLPYHLARNQTHLFLTAYYAIPLAVWLVVALAEGRRLLDRERSSRRRTLLVIGICLLVGAASNYYAVFALLMLVTVVPVAALARRSRAIALQGAAVTALVAGSFALCHAPAIVYPLVHGANPGVAERQPSDSELFGLKLTYMVLPRPEHRVDFLARRGERYLNNTLQRGEGFGPSLGVVGSIGFLAALIALLTTGLAGRGASLRRSRVATAGAVALSAFLMGTVGGVSALVAFELSPQVRAWNRLSLVIAFAALLTVALALTALGERLRARGRPAWVAGAAAVAVGLLGLFDQTSPSDAPNYGANAAAWKIDEDFVAAIERRHPRGAQVVQLPYMAYPENGQLNAIADYGMFRPYFHSERMRWTYGAVRGRPTDWLGHQRALTPEQLAAGASAAGFGGVYLDAYGHAGGGADEVQAALEKLAGSGTTLASADARLRFFDLRPAASRLAARTTPAERAALQAALLHPVVLGFGDGFYYEEAENGIPFRWAREAVRLTLDNPLRGVRTVRLTAQLFGGAEAPSSVAIALPDGTRKVVSATNAGAPLDVTFTLRRGESSIGLTTTGPPAPNPAGNVRDLRLRVVDAKIGDVRLQRPRYVAAATP